MKVKLEDIIEAMEFANMETEYYYDTHNEKVLMLFDGMVDIIFFCHHLLELQFLACETANLHFISDNKINLLAPREITKFKTSIRQFF